MRRRKRVVLKKSLCAAIRNNNFCASRGATRKMKNTMFLILMIYKIMIYEQLQYGRMETYALIKRTGLVRVPAVVFYRLSSFQLDHARGADNIGFVLVLLRLLIDFIEHRGSHFCFWCS